MVSSGAKGHSSNTASAIHFATMSKSLNLSLSWLSQRKNGADEGIRIVCENKRNSAPHVISVGYMVAISMRNKISILHKLRERIQMQLKDQDYNKEK